MSDIDAIRRRLDAASPGPWEKVDGVDTISYDSAYPYIFIMAPSGEIVAQLDDSDNHADARLIANAPTAIAALLAEVDRQARLLEACTSRMTRLEWDLTDLGTKNRTLTTLGNAMSKAVDDDDMMQLAAMAALWDEATS